MSFICVIIKNHFHKKGFVFDLVIKQRLAASRKWPCLLLLPLLLLPLGPSPFPLPRIAFRRVNYYASSFPRNSTSSPRQMLKGKTPGNEVAFTHENAFPLPLKCDSLRKCAENAFSFLRKRVRAWKWVPFLFKIRFPTRKLLPAKIRSLFLQNAFPHENILPVFPRESTIFSWQPLHSSWNAICIF